jgi:hypothetical protein
MSAVDPRFVKKIKGKEFIAFEGLLDLAHQEGLNSVETQLLQFPSDQNGNTAIAHAKVRTDRGGYSGIGDASPANVRDQIAPHLIRMAETRALVRALRWATNVGQAALEELGDAEEDTRSSNGHPTDEQLARLNQLLQSPHLTPAEVEQAEQALPRMSSAEAEEKIAVWEARLRQNGERDKPQSNGSSNGSGAGNRQPISTALISSSGNGHTDEDAEPPATEKQVATIEKTLAENGDLLLQEESVRIQALLDSQLPKRKASDVLDWLLGKSVRNSVTGAYEKISPGILAERRANGARREAA